MFSWLSVGLGGVSIYESVNKRRIQEIHRWRKPGQQFEYLGMKMAIVRGYIRGAGFGFVPGITANYLDKNLQFQIIEFSYHEFLEISRQNP